MIIETWHTDNAPGWVWNYLDKFEEWVSANEDQWGSVDYNAALEHYCQNVANNAPVAVGRFEPLLEKDDLGGYYIYNFCWREEKDRTMFILKYS